MKTYKDYIAETSDDKSEQVMRDWIIQQTDHTTKTYAAIKKEFDKKFAKGDKKLLAYFEQVVDSIVL